MTEPCEIEEFLGEFSDEEIRRGVHSFPIKKYLRCSPSKSLLYAVLCAVHEGMTTREKLQKHLEGMFAARLRRFSVIQADVDEAIQHGINDSLLRRSGNRLLLTDLGVEVLRNARLEILHSGYWMRRMLTEQFVLILSALLLIVLAASKIWVGMLIGSEGMLTEGIENSVDLIKVGIIAMSVRFKRDRLGAIIIIGILLITGVTLTWEAIESLLNYDAFSLGFNRSFFVHAYLITGFSLGINTIMVGMKVLVGRMSGNLSLLSDAKDNELHFKMSFGVMIGLSFAIFHFYFVDVLIALLIASLIIWEAIITMKELVTSGEELDINTVKLGASGRYEDKVTDWLLTRLIIGPMTPKELDKDFRQCVSIGIRYYDLHATLGHHKLPSKGIMMNIRQAMRSGLIDKAGDKVSITNLGLSKYYKFRSREFHLMANEFARTGLSKWTYVKIVLVIISIILIVIHADYINSLLSIL